MKLVAICSAAILLAPDLGQADCSDNASHFLTYSDEVVAARNQFFTSMCGGDKGELFDYKDPSLNGHLEPPTKPHNRYEGDFYPDSARRLLHEGTTIAAYVVDTKGNVVAVSVIKSSGYDDLDQGTITAIKYLHYEHPAKLDGNAVRVILYMPIKWHVR